MQLCFFNEKFYFARHNTCMYFMKELRTEILKLK